MNRDLLKQRLAEIEKESQPVKKTKKKIVDDIRKEELKDGRD